MKRLGLTTLAALAASPAYAAGEYGFFSLKNTDFIVLIAFVIFVGILVYFKVPGMIGGMLDKRAEGIQSELDEARALREEAQTLLASYERKQKEVQAQADRIVEQAKEEATRAAEEAKSEIQRSVERRMATATEQLASAEASAVKEVRDRAASAAVAAAQDVIAAQMTAASSNSLIDSAIAEVEAKLN